MNERLIQRKDRKLGHEWREWSEENAHAFPPDSTSKASLWLIVMPATMLFIIFILYGVLLPAGRLIGFPAPLYGIMHIALLILVIGMFIYPLLVAYSFVHRKDYAFFIRARRLLAGLTFYIGHILHSLGIVSRDRLGHSFIQILNRLQLSRLNAEEPRGEPARCLLLLPRCIEQSVREAILASAGRAHMPHAIAADGATARKAVDRHNPGVILAIACERDIVTGIRDVRRKIPIVCVSIRRPLGPCKDCVVDIDEVNALINRLENLA